MTRLAMSVGVLLLLGSCSGATLLSGEGVACSTDSDDDPYRKCDRAEADYVCINSYKIQQTPVWVCRAACTDVRDCRTQGDVCCEAPIHGNNLGKKAACLPATDCDPPSIIVPPPIVPVTMVPDTGVDARMSIRDAAATPPLTGLDSGSTDDAAEASDSDVDAPPDANGNVAPI
ncbi:MAG: hypothetical protein SGI86_10060 [Deltaproteobacteria bacterium]|nr:hypothetical protein [Deltaproteobacteria bacterium]